MLKEKKITQLELKKANLRSGDRSRCNAEWLKEGGDEMIDKI